MKFNLRYLSSTSACFELANTAPYYAPAPYDVMLDGVSSGKRTANVFSLFGLKPDTAYTVGIEGSEFLLSFTTRPESACLNAADFECLQTALDACPRYGRVFVPRGTYRTGPLLLHSHMTLELTKGAVLLAETDPARFPVWPGEVQRGQGGMLQISSWEGEPRACYQSFLSAHHKRDINIVGEGTLDGDAQNGVWWIEPKKQPIGRPRMLFLNDCERVAMHGVTVRNAPSWNLHPFFSRELGFYDLKIEAPADSPNTDGCNPESCDGVDILGVRFSVGDDAVAIKSGKLYMGAAYKTPSQRIRVRNCLMESAHGGVTLGSEIAGGVRELDIRQCVFDGADRGLRVKTRRGRGENCVIDSVTFSNIVMKNVKTPLVINMYYDRDPGGICEYVWSREALPVDARTPHLGRFRFKDITCTGCEYAAGYFDGLPERPIAEVTLENVSFTINPDANAGYPAMMTHIEPHCKRGLIFRNVTNVILKNVTLIGAPGETLELENVESVEGDV